MSFGKELQEITTDSNNILQLAKEEYAEYKKKMLEAAIRGESKLTVFTKSDATSRFISDFCLKDDIRFHLGYLQSRGSESRLINFIYTFDWSKGE